MKKRDIGIEKIKKHREQINQIDKNLLNLLKQRFKVVRQIKVIKEAHGISLYDPKRESFILEKTARKLNNFKERQHLIKVFKKMLLESRKSLYGMLLGISIFISFSAWGSKVGMEKISWFKSKDCVELKIKKYKTFSEMDLVSNVTIKNKEAVKSIMDCIELLSVKGNEMIKWGPKAQLTELEFKCSDQSLQKITIIQDRIKTPATSFLKKNNPIEEKLVQDINALLKPSFDTPILKIIDYPIRFKSFSVTFVRHEHRPQPVNGPTIGPTNQNIFQIREDGSANLFEISIHDGQIPPQPQPFVIGKKTFYLITYQNNDKVGLYPDYFIISEKTSHR